MTKILAAIMCGGSRPPLERESRASLPKQFIPLIGDRSSFQSIVDLVVDRAAFDGPVVITNFDDRLLVAEQLKQIGAEATILLEPEPRFSAAAVGALAAYASARDPEAIVAVLGADHVFRDREKFVALCVRAGAVAAAGEIVTFGVKPDHPATVYGYIHPAEPLAVDPEARRVERFVEKPDKERARAFVEDGYLWNSGNFVFRADVMLEELERFEPEIAAAAKEAVALARKDLGFLVLDRDALVKAPRKSIDNAVMERTRKAAVLVADVGWSDVRQWSVTWELGPQETPGVGDAQISGGSTPRSDRAAADKLKDAVERLKAEGPAEATQPARMHRPWGYYQIVDEGVRHQVRRIVVRPGGRIALKKHHHRAEHWIILRGVAQVTIDGAARLLHENESIYVPIGAEHRLDNPARVDLELIEVETGLCLGDDDVVRIEQTYRPT
jgi:mannose-1-phosphate guanylyltransferase/mannose-6-phosphate isomerase